MAGGWHERVAATGSTKPGTVTGAGEPSLDVPPGTLNAILRPAGLKREK
jgi:hypothetical protein